MSSVWVTGQNFFLAPKQRGSHWKGDKQMIIKKMQRLGVFLAAVILASALTAPARAGWETGANAAAPVAEALAADKGYTAEDYVTEVLELVNKARADTGLKALTGLEALRAPADLRAQESSVLFSHTRPDGRSCGTVYADSGLYYKKAGENLSYGYADPAALVAAWMDSQSHRGNLLNANFLNAGVGYYISENGTIYCSMLFYTAQAS